MFLLEAHAEEGSVIEKVHKNKDAEVNYDLGFVTLCRMM